MKHAFYSCSDLSLVSPSHYSVNKCSILLVSVAVTQYVQLAVIDPLSSSLTYFSTNSCWPGWLSSWAFRSLSGCTTTERICAPETPLPEIRHWSAKATDLFISSHDHTYPHHHHRFWHGHFATSSSCAYT